MKQFIDKESLILENEYLNNQINEKKMELENLKYKIQI